MAKSLLDSLAADDVYVYAYAITSDTRTHAHAQGAAMAKSLFDSLAADDVSAEDRLEYGLDTPAALDGAMRPLEAEEASVLSEGQRALDAADDCLDPEDVRPANAALAKVSTAVESEL